jgi:hypothetical protein
MEGILDIDCSLNFLDDLREWYHKQMVLVQLDDKLSKLELSSIWNYLKTKTNGNAWRFFSEKPNPELPPENKEVVNYVYTIFENNFKDMKMF